MTCMCVDLFVETDTVVVGGEALNFAANACKYSDVRASLLGPLDSDRYADSLMGFLKGRNIDAENVHILKGTTAIHKIHITSEGDRYHPGFICEIMRSGDIVRAMNEGSRLASDTLSHVETV